MSFFRGIVEQRVLANLMFCVILAAGFLVVGGMPVEEYPNVSLDKIKITVPWPGAAPEEIERLISRKIEDRLRDVDGIEWLQTDALPDRCEAWIKVSSKVADFQTLYRDIQTEVSKLRALPDGAEDPIVTKIDIEEMGPVIQVVVGLAADSPALPALDAVSNEDLLRSVGEQLQTRLELIDMVKKVRAYGIRDRELRVRVAPNALERYGLDIDAVARIIQERNIDLPAGSIAGAGREIMVRGRSGLESVASFSDIVLRSDDRGPTTRLGDVARFEWGFAKEYIRARFRKRRCVTLAVVKENSGNALAIAKDVREALASFAETAPARVTLDVVADTTVRIRERVAVLKTNILLGLGMVLAVLWLTIGFKNALLGSLGIPFAFLCSLLVLDLGGESINLISLFSMVLVLGVIVDDALVVLENIHRHYENGEAFEDAVVNGAAEVALPVLSATLTTIAAFLPLLLMPGTTGKFFSIIPKTVTYALLASLFECLIILPVHVLDLGPGRHRGGEGSRRPGMFLPRLRGAYLKSLTVFLKLRYLSLVGIFALGFLATQLFGKIPVLFFPSDFKQFFVNISLPLGSSLDETEAIASRASTVLEAMPRSDIESALCNVGMTFDSNYKPHTESHLAQFFVTTTSNSTARRPIHAIMADVRQQLEAAGLAGATLEVTELSDGPPVGKPITIRLRGDRLTSLDKKSAQLAKILSEIDGVKGVDRDYKPGKDELLFRLDEDAASRHGVSAGQVSRALAWANDGVVLTRWTRPGDDDEADVRVLYDTGQQWNRASLGQIRIKNRHGALLPLSEVVTVERTRGTAAIHRYQGKRAITISADIDTSITTALAASQLARHSARELPQDPGISVDYEGEFAETNRSFESLRLSFVVATGLIFMVLGAQFRSFLQPLVVLATVPFSFIGVVFGLWLTGDPFTVVSGIAIVGLAGMVVNDSLVLVDFVNKRRAQGLPLVEAVTSGSLNRMRAVLLTTITTVFGVLPMALGLGGRSTIWSPMATSIAFGLSFATLLTLFVIPAFYLILEDALWLVGRGQLARFEAPADGPSIEQPTAAPADAEAASARRPDTGQAEAQTASPESAVS